MRKAQVSMEYLAIFSFAILMTIPLILIFTVQTTNIQEDVARAQSYKVLSKIADSAEEVYYQGPPAKKTIRITFPEGITDVNVETNFVNGHSYSYVEFVFGSGDSGIPITKDTAALLDSENSSLNNFPGEHVIVITAQSDNKVLLEDK